ncbi:hypothetical protein ACQJBY_001331 [Aegilops geniculata]
MSPSNPPTLAPSPTHPLLAAPPSATAPIPSITKSVSCNPCLDPAPPPLNPILMLPPNPHRQLPTPAPPTHAAAHPHPCLTRIPAQSRRRIRSKSSSRAAGGQIHHGASRSAVAKQWSSSTRELSMPFKFVQIHSAQRDLTEEEEEKDHREVFMAQLLAHDRRCS